MPDPAHRPDPAALLEPVREALAVALSTCDHATLSEAQRLRAVLAHVMMLAGWLEQALAALDAGDETQ
jgi:hypothetical protein